MKRYWAAALFAVFIVGAIGSYYIQAASDRLPTFRLETLEGDGSEAAHLMLRGQYENEPYFEAVDVAAKGSRYEVERSIFRRLSEDWYRSDHKLDKLIRQYPNFMRGNVWADYDDDDMLVRVKLVHMFKVDLVKPGYRFKVDKLDKRSDKIISFEAEITDAAANKATRIIDVQRFGTVLKIAVEIADVNEAGVTISPEIRIYDIDMEQREITGSTFVEYGLIQDPGQEIKVNQAWSGDWTAPSGYLVLDAYAMGPQAVSVNDAGSANEADRETAIEMQKIITKRQLIVYSYADGKTSLIPVDVEREGENSQSNAYADDSSLLWVHKSTERVAYKLYDLADAKLIHEGQMTSRTLNAETIENLSFGPNRIYLYLRSTSRHEVASVNTGNGNVVYRGAVTLDGLEEVRKKSMLSKLRFFVIDMVTEE